MLSPDLRPVTAYGSIRHSDLVHDESIKKAEKLREVRVRRCIAEDLLEEIEDFEHKLGWRMRSRLGPKGFERRSMERKEQRTMGIKIPIEPRPKSPLLLYDYSHSPTINVSNEKYNHSDVVQNNNFFNSGVHSYGNLNGIPNSSGGSLCSPLRAHTAPGAGPLRNSSRLWTSHSMIEPIFLPISSSHRSAADHIAHAQIALMSSHSRNGSSCSPPCADIWGSRHYATLDVSSKTDTGHPSKTFHNLRLDRQLRASLSPLASRSSRAQLDPASRSELEFQR
jgi:hypothetical protein